MTRFLARSRTRFLRRTVLKTITNRFAVNSSVLAMVRRTKPVGNVKLDKSVTRPGFELRNEGAPPAIRMSNNAPSARKAPARNDLVIKTGQGSRAFALPQIMSVEIVSFVGS